MRTLPFLALLAATPAAAFTEPDSGAWLSLSAGLGMVHPPVALGPSWQLSGGVWFGKHDDAYAIGKYTGVGVTARQGLYRADLLTEPMLEIRHGADIFVVSTQMFLSGGPAISPDGLGVTMLAGAGAKYRKTARFGLTGRVELGATGIDGDWGFRGNLVLGIEWSSPFKKRSPPESNVEPM
jgi:hypothetical protein